MKLPVVNQCADTDGDGDCHLCAYHNGFVCPKNVRTEYVWQWKPHPFDQWVDYDQRRFDSVEEAMRWTVPEHHLDFRLIKRTTLDKVVSIHRRPRTSN